MRETVAGSQPGADSPYSYAEDGFAIFRGVFGSEEILTLDSEANRLYQRNDLIDTDNIRCRWQNHFQTKECRFDCFDPVIDLSSLCETRCAVLVNSPEPKNTCLRARHSSNNTY
jgi:hypothetical protein